MPDAGLDREGRFVAGLGALAFDGFDQGAFFAADVAAGADKNFQVEVEIGAQDFFAEQAGAIAAANFLAEDFFLEMVFVADIEDAFFRAADESGQDHAFDDQVRKMGEDEAVLDGAGLAFVGVADDVFFGPWLFADQIPLHAGGETGAAHAAEFGGFEFSERAVPIFGGGELAGYAVLLVVGVGVGGALHAGVVEVRGFQRVAAKGAVYDLFGAGGGDVGENLIIDGSGWGVIAAAQAGDVANQDFLRAGGGEAMFQVGAQVAGAVEVAAHVGADADIGCGRRGQMKMGVEAGDAVNLIQGRAGALRQSFQLRLRQEAIAQLYGPQVVEDHGVPSRVKGAERFPRTPYSAK